MFDQDAMKLIDKDEEGERRVSCTGWRDAAIWNCWQMIKDVIIFTKVNSFPLNCQFVSNGFVLAGQTESPIESRFQMNWQWLNGVIRDLCGWRFRPAPRKKLEAALRELEADSGSQPYTGMTESSGRTAPTQYSWENTAQSQGRNCRR